MVAAAELREKRADVIWGMLFRPLDIRMLGVQGSAWKIVLSGHRAVRAE